MSSEVKLVIFKGGKLDKSVHEYSGFILKIRKRKYAKGFKCKVYVKGQKSKSPVFKSKDSITNKSEFLQAQIELIDSHISKK